MNGQQAARAVKCTTRVSLQIGRPPMRRSSHVCLRQTSRCRGSAHIQKGIPHVWSDGKTSGILCLVVQPPAAVRGSRIDDGRLFHRCTSRVRPTPDHVQRSILKPVAWHVHFRIARLRVVCLTGPIPPAAPPPLRRGGGPYVPMLLLATGFGSEHR